MDDNAISGRFRQFCSLADANRNLRLSEFALKLADRYPEVFAFMVRYPDFCIRYFYGE